MPLLASALLIVSVAYAEPIALRGSEVSRGPTEPALSSILYGGRIPLPSSTPPTSPWTPTPPRGIFEGASLIDCIVGTFVGDARLPPLFHAGPVIIDAVVPLSVPGEGAGFVIRGRF